MESSTPVFIDTQDLAKLVETEGDYKILNCTVSFTPEEGDAILQHHESHIPK